MNIGHIRLTKSFATMSRMVFKSTLSKSMLGLSNKGIGMNSYLTRRSRLHSWESISCLALEDTLRDDGDLAVLQHMETELEGFLQFVSRHYNFNKG